MTRFKLTIGRKIYALVAIGFIGCALISALGIWQLNQSLQEQKRVELRHLVEAAVKLIQHEHEEATAGKQTMEEARAKAAHHLSAMRYGDNDYFVIQSKADGTIVMHPRTEMIGKDMHKMKAPDGRTMGAIIEGAVKERGFGYATYDFPKAGKEKPQPKLAYVHDFAPWQWMIVTGVYIDDLNAQVFAFIRNMLIIIAALTLVGGAISFAVARTIGPPIRKVGDTMHQLAAGNISQEIGYTERRDEVGDVARAALSFKESLQRIEAIKGEQQKQEANALRQRQDDMRQIAERIRSSVGSVVEAMQTLSASAGHAPPTWHPQPRAPATILTPRSAIFRKPRAMCRPSPARSPNWHRPSTKFPRKVPGPTRPRHPHYLQRKIRPASWRNSSQPASASAIFPG